ncbi:MAG TPA: carbamoyl-phosphate synthase (glutamine-hydrolyzing) large subunit [Treponemataceae bacterium]|nr:carbamoyl-phosphate synthase (glutamine-hydrolyzing) large subunit [Treponemataceae bacterium]
MKFYKITTPKKVLILGSGAHKIGQAGEFDSACIHSIRALQKEGIKTVLVNPNMTAVQTSEGIADSTYFLPVSPEFVESVIEKEKPDSILIHCGGKTAFACALELQKKGTFERYNIQVLGTPIEVIEKIANREEFISTMNEIGVRVPVSLKAMSIKEAISQAEELGYPVIIRSAVSREESLLEICNDSTEILSITERLFQESPHILIEKFLGGFKEVELEILRDAMDNCIMVCSMENIDPLGIHTGDSLIVIPAQTLSGDEIQNLRNAALKTARELGIIGEAVMRFAINPETMENTLIEVTARISRSTALAAKATGFQLGYISSRIALGYSLSEIENALTGTTRCCAEPAFDYIAIKMPRWDAQKFNDLDRELGKEMKSVGESLAFGRTFTEALQKAIRMSESPGLFSNSEKFKDLKEALRKPTDERIFALYTALCEGWTTDRIYKYVSIDRWFIDQIREIASIELTLRALKTNRPAQQPSQELLRVAKQAGFSDYQIAICIGSREEKVRALRKELSITPVIKAIDSLSGEITPKGNCLYMTYSGVTDDVKSSGNGILVLGSGPYHIGSSLEYDWCCTSALQTIKKEGKTAIMLNCNPEAVSTDWDRSDRLYFEEITLERVRDIYEAEEPEGVLLSMGGQLSNNLAIPLSRIGIPVLGTNPADIDRAEDRNKFSALLDQLDIHQPEWTEVTSIEEAHLFAKKTGYPLLLRPNHVTSGAAMSVAWDEVSLRSLLSRAFELGLDHPVVLTQYVENSKEIEIDAVAQKGEILVYAISEHIENAGVHSGDATVVLPAQRIYLSTAQAIKKAARKIAAALEITGPFNIKFLAKSTNISVIECNLRASRSFPFCSKVFHLDMASLAVQTQLGISVNKIDGSSLDFDHVGIRAAQFNYSKMKSTDPVAGVEMTSTGEVGCMGSGVRDAFMKAMLSTGYRIPQKKILLSTGPIENKIDFIESAKKLISMGYTLVASRGTARFLQNNDIEATALPWPLEDKHPNIADALNSREIDLVINIPKNNRETELRNDYNIRRLSVDLNIPLITNIKIAKQFIDSLEWYKTRGLEVKSREEYH